MVTAQPTMIREIRGAEAACSVHESPFGADDWVRFSGLPCTETL